MIDKSLNFPIAVLVQHGVNSAKLSQCGGRVPQLKTTGVGGVGFRPAKLCKRNRPYPIKGTLTLN
ncbi:hypothetical protein HCG51_26365 [Tolypothrix sp. PCC 7910]|uniref:hypothetical protein n=1 Tax=Tolypothrix sp. PCC 7910 TaxID=2099387 RepID=UPI00142786C4|nr:hypothetical protein [Tolypothrix sp. PCC 7910]QIR39883.1 hypothetical protein HCG51_26365 [Tolypothrix sp. PCC 7910]